MTHFLLYCGRSFSSQLDIAARAFRGSWRTISLVAISFVLVAPEFVCPAANAQTNEWTWMGGTQTPQIGVYGTLGTPAIGNMPGNREGAVSWTDTKGNLWLFGGDGFDSVGMGGYLNDLWEYNPSTNEWAWMGGNDTANDSGVLGTLGTPAQGNIPAGRQSAVSWTDSKGNL
ncbi:MAG: kelch repeat-containing protein [Terracidiphilus sp.]